MNIGREVDHIVYAVKNLDQGIERIHELLGVKPVFGGYHKNKGTKNALLHIGHAAYLEIISIDPDNHDIKTLRWMGVDLIQESQVTRWSLKSADLQSDANHLIDYQDNLGNISGGSREMTDGKRLQWEMILPLSEPEVEIIPFMTDWGKSSLHPTDKLSPDCMLMDMTLSHPNPKQVNQTMEKLNLKIDIEKSAKAKISLTIQCPNGMVTLS